MTKDVSGHQSHVVCAASLDAIGDREDIARRHLRQRLPPDGWKHVLVEHASDGARVLDDLGDGTRGVGKIEDKLNRSVSNAGGMDETAQDVGFAEQATSSWSTPGPFVPRFCRMPITVYVNRPRRIWGSKGTSPSKSSSATAAPSTTTRSALAMS